MKALNLDSSLNARKQLAKELNYTGDTNDSATMNIWLHRQIMRKLTANGGIRAFAGSECEGAEGRLHEQSIHIQFRIGCAGDLEPAGPPG